MEVQRVKKQVTNMEVKKNNRNLIFRYIRACDTVSNPDIAYALKISLPTVTQNTKELIERGLVQEKGELQSTGGRRAKALSVAADCRLAAGLDITKNHVGMLLTNLTGEVLKYERIYMPYPVKDMDGAARMNGQPDKGFESEAAYYRALSQKFSCFIDENVQEKDKILGVGISFPGIVDLQKREIAYSHALNVKSVAFDKISEYFPYPCSFFNDANAGAYAEGLNRKSQKGFFYLSLSNTVGGAVFNNDTLVQGNNFRCGEAGHMTIVPDGRQCYCGKKGCLDAYCSAARLSDMAGGKLEDFFKLLDQRDAEAVRQWEQYAACLAVAVNNIHMVLDCDVILGGYTGSYMDAYIDDIRKRVSQRNTFDEDGSFVRTCRYKVGAAALGAALKVIEGFVEQI